MIFAVWMDTRDENVFHLLTSAPFSTTATLTSPPSGFSFTRWRKRRAAANPAGPPPTMTTSKARTSRGGRAGGEGEDEDEVEQWAAGTACPPGPVLAPHRRLAAAAARVAKMPVNDLMVG